MILQDQPDKSDADDRDLELRFGEIADSICIRLAKNESVRRTLPGGGRLRIDRQLPFLCVYRAPEAADDVGTRELVTTEASYLFGPGDAIHHRAMASLCRRVSAAMQEHFGVFLLLEIWSLDATNRMSDSYNAPAFEIVTPDREWLPSTVDAFKQALADITIHNQPARVDTLISDHVGPPDLPSFTSIGDEQDQAGCCVLGLAVKPIYRDSESGSLFPMVLQALRGQLAIAIRKTVAQFSGVVAGHVGETEQLSKRDAISYHSLGPTSLVKAARLVDHQLSEVSESFDFLLQVTPTNATEAWEQFYESGFSCLPSLTYRSLPYHPALLKRRLFDIEIERIEDPTLAHLFWEKQEELDRQLTALRDLNTPQFLYGSLQMYGDASESLVQIAREILEQFPVPELNSNSTDCVETKELIENAYKEIDHYHTRMSEFNANIVVSDEIAAGMMVSHDQLLVASNIKLSRKRLQPLLHHEVGTHLLTYFNGRCQPFRQLYAGLAGFEELQEGLAVFAEYLTGGLTTNRIRTLAGRVIAVQSMTSGATFADTFAQLHELLKFGQRRAFDIALRVYRGGGFTKDIIYLRGLNELLKYFAAGHEIEPLYVGKIGLQHVPYVQEMRRRKIILAPKILPRFWDDQRTHERFENCRGKSIQQLLEMNR